MPTKETVIGVVGVLLIVVGMQASISALQAPPGDEEGSARIGGPPPQLGQASWTAEVCTQVLLGWQVDPSTVEDTVGPWRPRTAGGTTLVTLYAYDCPDTLVSGIEHDGAQGGGLLVAIEPPTDQATANATANTTAEAWHAQPEAFVQTPSALASALEGQAFTVTDASVTIETTDALIGQRITVTWATDQGTVTADLVRQSTPLAGSQLDPGTSWAVVNTQTGTLGLQTGSLSGTYDQATASTVQSNGQTWVSELGLGSMPDSAGISQEAAWAFDLVSWDLGTA